MRRTLILTLAALACALALCAGGTAMVNKAVDEAQGLRREAMLAYEAGDPEGTGAAMDRLEALWRSRADRLELLTSHDALHEVAEAIAEARIFLTCGDRGDFLRAMSAADLGLEHLRDEQAARWANLY